MVGEMKQVQQRLDGQIRSASFDRGFHSPENQADWPSWWLSRACPNRAMCRPSAGA